MSDSFNSPPSSTLNAGGSQLGTELMSLLIANDIQPGDSPSYQICKTIYLYHPLGAKMVEAPLNIAQSQAREIDVPGHPERVARAFLDEWKRLHTDVLIFNTARTARIYGISSVVVGAVDKPTNAPLTPKELAGEQLFFNVLDPLNTAGSLVLNQNPNSPDFQAATTVVTGGQTYHRSRVCIIMNEQPIYIAYTSSSFGFVGRSVYQRALFPLKSFINTMIADDMIARKLGLLIAKMEAPSSVIDKMMTGLLGMKRALLQQAQTDNVLGIGKEEDIATLNMMNVDGAGTYSRNDILKNCATAADMPAVLLENETLVQGFGEGREDAKRIAEYADRVREWMQPLYDFFDGIVQQRAWNRDFFASMQQDDPETYGNMRYEAALSKWRAAFTATWPSLLREPESERVKVDDTRLRATIALMQVMVPMLDPTNKATFFSFVEDAINSAEMLFPGKLTLDVEALADFTPPTPGMNGESGDQGGGLAQPKPPAFRMKAAA